MKVKLCFLDGLTMLWKKSDLSLASSLIWRPLIWSERVSAIRISNKRHNTEVLEQELEPHRSTQGFFFHSFIYFSINKGISHRMYQDSARFLIGSWGCKLMFRHKSICCWRAWLRPRSSGRKGCYWGRLRIIDIWLQPLAKHYSGVIPGCEGRKAFLMRFFSNH